MRRRGPLVAAALLAALAGCGGGEDKPLAAASSEAPSASAEPTPTPSESPTTAAPASVGPAETAAPVRQQEAAQALRAGVRRLLGGGIVDFRFQMRLGATALTATTGRADVSGGWRSSTVFSAELTELLDAGDGVQDLGMEVRAPLNRGVFMQMVGWDEPFAGCWLQMGPGLVPVGVLAMTPGVPAYVGVLGAVKALGFPAEDSDGSRIAATISLRGALLLLHGQVVQALAVPPDAMSSPRVPATVYLEDGVVTDVTVEGLDVVDGVRAAGGNADTKYAGYLASVNLTVRYTPGPVGAQAVTAPDAGLIFSLENMDADRGC